MLKLFRWRDPKKRHNLIQINLWKEGKKLNYHANDIEHVTIVRVVV